MGCRSVVQASPFDVGHEFLAHARSIRDEIIRLVIQHQLLGHQLLGPDKDGRDYDGLDSQLMLTEVDRQRHCRI